MTTDRREFERLEQIILRSTGDLAEAIGRCLEQVEERIDDAEMSIRGSLAELKQRLPVPAVGSDQ